MQLPKFDSYCENTTKVNALMFDFGLLVVWFSYKTPVAFRALGSAKPTVRENEWGSNDGEALERHRRWRQAIAREWRRIRNSTGEGHARRGRSVERTEERRAVRGLAPDD